VEIGDYEVALPPVKWMPGSERGVTNALGIESVEHHRFERRAGLYDPTVLTAVRDRIAWMLELSKVTGLTVKRNTGPMLERRFLSEQSLTM